MLNNHLTYTTNKNVSRKIYHFMNLITLAVEERENLLDEFRGVDGLLGPTDHGGHNHLLQSTLLPSLPLLPPLPRVVRGEQCPVDQHCHSL